MLNFYDMFSLYTYMSKKSAIKQNLCLYVCLSVQILFAIGSKLAEPNTMKFSHNVKSSVHAFGVNGIDLKLLLFTATSPPWVQGFAIMVTISPTM